MVKTKYLFDFFVTLVQNKTVSHVFFIQTSYLGQDCDN